MRIGLALIRSPPAPAHKKNGPAPESAGRAEVTNALGGTRRGQSSPSHRKEDFMRNYSYYLI